MSGISSNRPWLRTLGVGLAALLAIGAGVAAPANAVDGIRMYDAQLIGPATPTEVNDTGVAVGYRFDNGGNRVPLVSTPGAGWSLLPLPPAATGAWPTDINTGGTVVGVSLSAAGAAAVRWTPSASGYAVDVLPRLAGETTSFATGINDAGQIVGARAAGIVFSPTEGGWLIDTDSSIRSLDPAFGGPSIPLDISGNGLVVAGTRLLDLGSGSVTDLGSQGPGSYLPITLTRVNSVGW